MRKFENKNNALIKAKGCRDKNKWKMKIAKKIHLGCPKLIKDLLT
jgi:hypothetical protein